MIKVNLAPPEELANPYWWIPDAFVLVLLTALGSIGVNYYLSFSSTELQQLLSETTAFNEKFTSLQNDVSRHAELVASLSSLESKQLALSKITESKLTRYLPIIVMEHIQNLKPEGVWLSKVAFAQPKPGTFIPPPPPPTQTPPNGSDSPAPEGTNQIPAQPTSSLANVIELEGHAFDNIIVAEFMTALKSTRNQEADPEDLRTQIYFEKVELGGSILSPIEQTGENTQRDRVDVVQFKLTLTFSERQPIRNQTNEIAPMAQRKSKSKERF